MKMVRSRRRTPTLTTDLADLFHWMHPEIPLRSARPLNKVTPLESMHSKQITRLPARARLIFISIRNREKRVY